MRTLIRNLFLCSVGFFLVIPSIQAADGDALKLAWFEIRPGIVVPGESTTITAWVENITANPLEEVTVRLTLPQGVELVGNDAASSKASLKSRQAKRFAWQVKANKPGVYTFSVEAAAQTAKVQQQQQILTVVERRDPKHEYQATSAAWHVYPARPTLQEGNSSPVSDFQALPSKDLKHNLFGITAHLPRGTDDETPFIAANALDGDLDTCWGSRWWRTAIPFEPEWIEIDLGEVRPAAEIRFLPGWRNSGVPAAFTIDTSADGKKWETVVDETDFHLQPPAGDKLQYRDLTWQCFKFAERPVRYARLVATRLNAGPTSFFCCPGDPFQLRIAELAVLDKDQKALSKPGDKIKVSTTHNAWFNNPETIKKTWPFLLQSGVKINRVGQWGDKLDWATVEKTKGTYVVDPDVDRSVTESVAAGVDILLTLDYGNNLYQQLKDPQDFGKSTWYRSHPFLQCAPTTPEAIEGFAKYCGFMAKHFKGRIKYFEIWNEENGWFFDAWSASSSVSMAKAYGKALAAAAKAVKEANPEAVVLFGGTAGATLDYPRIAMQEGAGPYIDIFAFHPYYHLLPESAPPELLTDVNGTMQWRPCPAEIKNFEDEVNAYKELFRPYNPNIQIWADEWNYFAPGEPVEAKSSTFMFPDASELSQAKFLARFFTQSAWLNTGAIWWSLYNANHVQEWALIRSADCTPRAAYYSAGYTATVLDDCKGVTEPKVQAVGNADENLVVKAYRNGKGELLVGVWRKTTPDDACQPTQVTLALPEITKAEIVDTLYGFKQSAVLKPVEGGVQITGLLVGDWPLVLRLEK